MQKFRRRNHGKGGAVGLSSGSFTLLELLVTISIIVILAAMVLPALGSVRKKTHQVVCMNNLHQIGMAYEMYSQDNDGYYPPYAYVFSPGQSGKWVLMSKPLQPQPLVGGMETSGSYTCSADSDPVKADFLDEYRTVQSVDISYAYNLNLFINGYRTHTVPIPGDCCLFVDADMQLAIGSWKPDPDWYAKSLSLRHSGGSNILFCDLHVAWLNSLEITDDVMNP